MLAKEIIFAIYVRIAPAWYDLYGSLHSFITCGWSVKELSFISYLLFLINPQSALGAAFFRI